MMNPPLNNASVSGFPYTQNRDLSWLQFNRRVLSESLLNENPLMERFRFLSISSNNLDEFFMIRIGSLYDIVNIKKDAIDARTGMPISDVIKMLYKEIQLFSLEMEQSYRQIIRDLKQESIGITGFSEIHADEKHHIKLFFDEQVNPILSPQVIDAHHPFPHILSKSLNIGLHLEKKGKFYLGIIPIPSTLPAMFRIEQTQRYVCIEDIILHMADQIYKTYTVHDRTVFSVTRNADLNYYDEVIDDATNARVKVKQILGRRRVQNVIRLEFSQDTGKDIQDKLMTVFQLKKYQTYVRKIPLQLDSIRDMIASDIKQTHPALFFTPYTPVWPNTIKKNESMIKQVLAEDFLLHYPYESIDPFLKLIREAADDSDVLSIKVTIYRLAKTAKLIEYLSRAAENGKEVLVVMELRARFDEQNNIDWSERLERAGCNIVYGLETLKVHSKILVITMKKGKQLRYITQVGTGNYNERTVEQYQDLSLLTAHQGIGLDAIHFFTQILLDDQDSQFQHMLISPHHLKSKILDLIEKETMKGELGRITMKLNAITDMDFIHAISRASQNGVQVHLIVRSICCIRPGIDGFTDHVKAFSIVGRFLEHSRIYAFGSGDDTSIYISSADMMTRNTERRVEVAVPIYDPKQREMIRQMLELSLKDSIKGMMIQKDGTHQAFHVDQPINIQEYMMSRASGMKAG